MRLLENETVPMTRTSFGFTPKGWRSKRATLGPHWDVQLLPAGPGHSEWDVDVTGIVGTRRRQQAPPVVSVLATSFVFIRSAERRPLRANTLFGTWGWRSRLQEAKNLRFET